MLVTRFLNRLSRSAPTERVKIVRALVRVYLEVPLDAENRTAAATALIAILDDPVPRVRRALAEGLAASPDAPRTVIRALAEDLPAIAHVVLSRSPVLREAELVDLVGAGCEQTRVSIARRPQVGICLAAAIVEVSGPEACVALLDNPGTSMTVSTLTRMVDRHRHDAAIRNALLERPDLPVTLRQRLIDGLSDALGELVALRDWLSPERARRLIDDTRDRAVIDLTLTTDPDRLRPLVDMLIAEKRLTPALLIRALCLGNVRFFEEAMSAMSGTPVRRVLSLLDDRTGRGLTALCRRAGLDNDALPALQAVVAVMREEALDGTWRQQRRMGQRMLERALTRHQSFSESEVDELFALLGRLAAEAAREDARTETGGYFRAA